MHWDCYEYTDPEWFFFSLHIFGDRVKHNEDADKGGSVRVCVYTHTHMHICENVPDSFIVWVTYLLFKWIIPETQQEHRCDTQNNGAHKIICLSLSTTILTPLDFICW